MTAYLSSTSDVVIEDATNLSGLFFERPSQGITPYVGPVFVSTSNTVAGRGLMATRDIAAGECLFVTPPTVSVDVHTVQREFLRTSDQSVEALAEGTLLRNMKDALSLSPPVARSFLVLQGAEGTNAAPVVDSSDNDFVETLLGRRENGGLIHPPTDDELLQIIRQNAFGPDFITYQVIQSRWEQPHDGKDQAVNPFVPHRILGMYPLAAMINHSCIPNAVRVFAATGNGENENCSDLMVVHAARALAAGEEIVWSYLPPLQPVKDRRSKLEEQYGFTCNCERCCVEQEQIESIPSIRRQLHSIDFLNVTSLDIYDNTVRKDLLQAMKTLQSTLQSQSLSNECRRYIQISYMNVYINYLNAALIDHAAAGLQAHLQDLLESTCTPLHFAFCACHYASTEHLSILHLCYQLISTLHVAATKDSSQKQDVAPKTQPKVRFWTEQLKRAHQVRYGKLGNDLETVRRIMMHTKTILRNKDGIDQVDNFFI